GGAAARACAGKSAEERKGVQMSHRSLASMGVLTVVVAVVSVSVAGQAPKAAPKAPAAAALEKAKTAPKNWTQTKTAWGDPDLQGVWSYATTTPLQRPDTAGGKRSEEHTS